MVYAFGPVTWWIKNKITTYQHLHTEVSTSGYHDVIMRIKVAQRITSWTSACLQYRLTWPTCETNSLPSLAATLRPAIA